MSWVSLSTPIIILLLVVSSLPQLQLEQDPADILNELIRCCRKQGTISVAGGTTLRLTQVEGGAFLQYKEFAYVQAVHVVLPAWLEGTVSMPKQCAGVRKKVTERMLHTTA